MFIPVNTPIWIYLEKIDFRKQIDGLSTFVAAHFGKNPASGQLFVFRNRAANAVKMLLWERNGFWLFHKRLEKGRLKFPNLSDEIMELTQDQLGWLLSGLDFSKQATLPMIEASHFF